MDKNLKKPEGLCPKGEAAYEAILSVLKEEGLLDEKDLSGGCKVFYSPSEWEEREETYGEGSVLIVTYDGGGHAPYFAMDHDYPKYRRTEKMREALDKIGLFTEECTGWYSAIYVADDFEDFKLRD